MEESWKISCRYIYVFRKLNHTNQSLKFCEAKSSIPLCKIHFQENFRASSTKTKMVTYRVDVI